MTKIELTIPNTPVLTTFTGKSIIHNPMPASNCTIWYSHQNSLTEPWIALGYQETLILDTAMYFMYKEGAGTKTLPVVEAI